MLEAEHLRKVFNKVEAVKGITLEVEAGEVFGFLGPNGAGKSTTIKMLTTLLKPTSGSARVVGYDVIAQRHQVRQVIGLVFQEQTLDERLTARENLVFHSMLYGLSRKTWENRLLEVLEMVELRDRADDLVRTFSGGMKRRLEIARGLIHFPRILFLDEPTVGLDPQTRSRIWEYIHRVREDHGVTIFLTTHYMDEAENCSRIAVIDHGSIIALGSPHELKDNLGGDTIRLVTEEPERAEAFVRQEFGLQTVRQGNTLVLTVPGSETFIPQLVTRIPTEVKSISMHKPTLDDVFLKLTGRAIREESAENPMRHLSRRH